MAPIAVFVAYLVAGMAAQFLGPYIQHSLPALMPQVSSTLAWQISLAFSGLLFALALVWPLALVAPPKWPHHGVALVAGYILGGIPNREPDGELVLLFQLPDIWGWAFLLTSLALIWLISRSHADQKVA
jgi:hypothetical protein